VSSSYLPNHETGEELFYQNTNLYPVNFLLYAPPPPPHIELNKQPNERTVDDLFIDRKLREYLQQKNEESLKSISNNELDLPSHVGIYHSLYPIDHNFEYSTKSFGYTSIVYKCMSNEDGKLYTMRRLQNVPISSPSVLKSIKKWKKVECANIAKVYDVFTTRAFNDNSLILIYDYYPMSMTLLENHFMSFPGKNPELITEDCLWNYTIQLLNAIAEVNKANLSIGSLDSSKIIITNKGRIRLSALGIKDVLQDVKRKLASENSLDNPSKNESDNESDLLHLGKLLLFLAKSTTFITNTEDPAEIIMQLKFTQAFKNMLLYLFDKDATIEKFQELVAPMILKITNGLQNSCDNMESTLMTELENARLIRLFAKLDFISERPEMVKDGSWSETGERYPIKLFKDYVFHQVDDNGKPVVDLTHVINCLNKLDAGVEENVLLVSPDEMTCLIMSYKDLKELINKSFLSLLGKE
jgi:PAB-dependent poly(A)-specific ribonuclease subunit 3